MSEQVKALVIKPDNLSCIPRTNVLKKDRLLRVSIALNSAPYGSSI